MNLLHSFFLIVIFFFSITAQEYKTNIAVLDLNGTGINTDDVLFLSNRLRTELFETGKFNVLERDQMNAILNEQGFQQSGCTTVDCAVEIGQLLNVQQMVGGSLGKIEDIYSITLRLIDVKTGAIIKTATQDHSGKLSTMLTEVIPVVSQILASEKKASIKKPVFQEISKTEIGKKLQNRGFVLSLRGGLSYAQYTNEVNEAIKNYNATTAIIDLPNFANHANITFEIGYFVTENWELKFGLAGNPLLSEWTYKADNDRFIRSYSFANVYFGFNSYIWTIGDKFDLFVGMDIGSFQMTTSTDTYSETLAAFAENWNNKYEDTRFATKLTLGALYPAGDFRFGAEITIRILGDHFPRTKDPIIESDLFEIIFPKEINASGTQLSLVISYDI